MAIISDFSTNSDGWQLTGDPTSTTPTYVASGGNTGGFIHGVDASQGIDWYFSAPSKFLGNQSDSIGGSLKFDLRRSDDPVYDAPDVILISRLLAEVR